MSCPGGQGLGVGRGGDKKGKGSRLALVPWQPLPSLCYLRSLTLMLTSQILPKPRACGVITARTLKSHLLQAAPQETQWSCWVKGPIPHVHSLGQGLSFPMCPGLAQHLAQGVGECTKALDV